MPTLSVGDGIKGLLAAAKKAALAGQHESASALLVAIAFVEDLSGQVGALQRAAEDPPPGGQAHTTE